MSQTLYRKYRSQRFADIIGQGPVVRILRNSIERGRLNHAYLFSGPRGTGKTSIARIFAKALNCLNPQDGDACGVCDVCRDIASGTAVDVIEIDAASNRGIDDIRDLRERVNYAPLELKRKVYIIDEVHMITGPAWNALLKTLEEPPTHVIFCLCTTEANKVPITILSRCIRFDFQRLPLPDLANHLESIASAEGFNMEPGCGLKLAQLAEGSARDAISLLDQLTVFCDSTITSKDIDELFQLGDPEVVRTIADSLAASDTATALEGWNTLMARGVDAGSFLLQISEELKERYLRQPSKAAQHALEAVWQGLNLLKYDNFPTLLVELTLIQAAQPGEHSAPQPAPASRSQATVQVPPSRQAPPAAPRMTAAASEPKPTAVEPEPLATKPDAEEILTSGQAAGGDLLQAFCEKVRAIRMTTAVLLMNGVTVDLIDNRLVLNFNQASQPAMAYAGKPDNLDVLREAARQLYGQHTVVELRREGGPQEHPVPLNIETAMTPEPAETEPRETGQTVSPAEALESRSADEASPRTATFEDAMRLFGNQQAEETQ
jgi:DNA polymerase-3 subunit gamma/tau